jgi:hypothetical protein
MEIAFWVFIIPLLRESTLLHHTLHILYPMAKRFRWISRVPKPVVWIAAGLTLGIGTGFLAGLILP